MEEVDTAYLFEDLDIFNNGEKYRKEQGKYPTVYLTFKNAKQNKWDSKRGTKTLDMLLEKAKNQIIEQKYKEGLKAVHGHENIVCMAVGFKGKDVKILEC